MHNSARPSIMRIFRPALFLFAICNTTLISSSVIQDSAVTSNLAESLASQLHPRVAELRTTHAACYPYSVVGD